MSYPCKFVQNHLQQQATRSNLRSNMRHKSLEMSRLRANPENRHQGWFRHISQELYHLKYSRWELWFSTTAWYRCTAALLKCECGQIIWGRCDRVWIVNSTMAKFSFKSNSDLNSLLKLAKEQQGTTYLGGRFSLFRSSHQPSLIPVISVRTMMASGLCALCDPGSEHGQRSFLRETEMKRCLGASSGSSFPITPLACPPQPLIQPLQHPSIHQ